MKKRQEKNKIMFLILISIFIFFILGFVNKINAGINDLSSPASTGFQAPESKWTEGAGLNDEEKWEEDKNKPSEWKKYDKTLTNQLTPEQLKANPTEAIELYNQGKLSKENNQMQELVKSLAKNEYFDIGENVNLEKSQIIDTPDGKVLLIDGQKTPVNLWDNGVTDVDIDSQGRLKIPVVLERDFVFDGKNLPPGTPAPQLVKPEPGQIPPELRQAYEQQQAGQQGGSSQGGGGGGGGGGGASLEDKLQQIIGLISQLAGLIPKPQSGQTSVNGNNEIALENGAGAYLPESGAEIAQNCVSGYGKNGECLDEPGIIQVSSENEKSLKTSNIEIVVPEQAVVYTPLNPKTEVELSGIKGDSPEIVSASSKLVQEYAQKNNKITGNVISDINNGQYVRFIQHNLAIGGERILIHTLKSFKEIQGKGSELWVKDGEMYTKFDGVKIYYSRKIGKTPYSVGTISNAMNNKNKFSVIKYKEDRARMTNSDNKISVGDKITEHPRINGLFIAKIREDMWVER